MQNRFEPKELKEVNKYLQDKVEFVKKKYKRVSFLKRVIRKLFS